MEIRVNMVHFLRGVLETLTAGTDCRVLIDNLLQIKPCSYKETTLISLGKSQINSIKVLSYPKPGYALRSVSAAHAEVTEVWLI